MPNNDPMSDTIDVDAAWRERAACRGMPTAIFFPDSGDWSNGANAKAICRHCAVIDACLDYGLSEKRGVWGGTSEKDRRRIRRRARRRGEAA